MRGTQENPISDWSPNPLAGATPDADADDLDRIEFGEVRAWLAGRASSPRSRRLVEALSPAADLVSAAARLAALAEGKRLVEERGFWPSPPPDDLMPAIEAARRGRRLDAASLLAVLRLLESVDAVRAYFREAAAEAPRAAEPAGRLTPAPELARALRDTLDADGEIKDAASPALARLRARRKETRARLLEKLERVVASEGIDPDEGGGFVTQRAGRYVVPVRADRFDRAKGVVHDTSRSGAVLFVEPFSALPANNELREIEVAEAQEVARILDALTARVADRADALASDEGALAELDFLAACVRLSREMAGATPTLVDGADGRLRLLSARHPLLWRQAGGATDPERARRDVVAFDLELGGAARVLLVSGPNMGGKTVLLKAVGLAVAMAASGLDVCAAEGTVIPFVREIHSDIGDAQSIAEHLSTFAARLRRMDRMARRAGPHTLCLLDEIGSGTDPEEGAALARALLERIGERGCWAVATTHLGSLKALASERPEIVNGSMEMDAERLEPRFRLLAGVPGGSYALVTARRLGLDRGVLERAEALAGEEGRSLSRLVADLTAELAHAREEREETRRALDAAAARLAELDRREREAERETTERQKRRLEEVRALESQARALLREVRREAERAPAEREADRLRVLGERVREVERAGDRLRAAGRADDEPQPPAEVAPGLEVRHAGLGVVARVVEGPDQDGNVILSRGAWRISCRVEDLRRVEPVAAESPRHGPKGVMVNVDTDRVAWEVDVRGMPVDEAVDALDHALDRAVLAGHRELRVIHGVGKGVLRDAVSKHLRGHPQVAGQHLGHVGEGGRGVTVAALS